MTAAFLSNESLWHTLAERLKAAGHVDAAIAYLGTGGAALLPLHRGDRLVIDMSIGTVRSGGTNPNEIERLMARGVTAFTRRNLHAKVIVAGGWVLSGSANVSKNARYVLDEAAILTTDKAAIRRAREFIDRLCTEPIRPEYLAECKREYRPPRFDAGPRTGPSAAGRTTHAKLWLVNLRESSVPEAELARYGKGEATAVERVRAATRSDTDSFHWPKKPKMASELEVGDWIVRVLTKKDKTIIVESPGQLLFMDHYKRTRGSDKERWVFHLEVPRRGQSMAWQDFRRAVRSVSALRAMKSPRTGPIRAVDDADVLLGLWTPNGRIAAR